MTCYIENFDLAMVYTEKQFFRFEIAKLCFIS